MAPGELDPLEDVAELLESLAAVALDRLHAAESVVVLLVAKDVIEGFGPAAFAELRVEELESGLQSLNQIRLEARLQKNLLVSDVSLMNGLFLHESEHNFVLHARFLQGLDVQNELILGLLRQLDVACLQPLQKIRSVPPIALHKFGYGLTLNLQGLFRDARIDLLFYKRVEVHACAISDFREVAEELFTSIAAAFGLADAKDLLVAASFPLQVKKLRTDCYYFL